MDKIQSVSNWCIHSLKRYFSATKWDSNTFYVVFYSLNFLKSVHFQNAHLLPQYAPNNDAEQSDIPSGLLLMGYHWWHIQNSMNTRFLDITVTRTLLQWLLWGSCENLHDCVSSLVISEISLSSAPTFQHILHRSIDSNLSRILVIVTLVSGVVPNSTIERRWTSALQ